MAVRFAPVDWLSETSVWRSPAGGGWSPTHGSFEPGFENKSSLSGTSPGGGVDVAGPDGLRPKSRSWPAVVIFAPAGWLPPAVFRCSDRGWWPRALGPFGPRFENKSLRSGPSPGGGVDVAGPDGLRVFPRPWSAATMLAGSSCPSGAAGCRCRVAADDAPAVWSHAPTRGDDSSRVGTVSWAGAAVAGPGWRGLDRPSVALRTVGRGADRSAESAVCFACRGGAPALWPRSTANGTPKSEPAALPSQVWRLSSKT